MFQKTRLQLTIQNSFILILVISAIATAVYSYMQFLLYSDLDEDLKLLMTEYEEIVETGFFPLEATVSKPTFIQDPRVKVLIWDRRGELIQVDEDEALFIENQQDFKPFRELEIEGKVSSGYHFRTIAEEFDTEYGTYTVQLLRNVNSEQEMIQRIAVLLLTGTAVGGILSIMAGFYLAGVALVPINSALKKQQQFVSDASHELRTPLAVIQSRADLLLRSPNDTIEARALDISVISKECRRLTKLVSNLLLLARSDSNRIQLKIENISMNDLLGEIMMNYEELAEIQNKKIHLEIEEDIKLKADPERIHQLVVILLDNALKFTDDQGEIKLQCRKTHQGVELSVKDNGIGISKEDLPFIFDRFYQGEKSRTLEEGTGLGLSIARWIVYAHHGRIKMISEEGKGTTCKILFPK